MRRRTRIAIGIAAIGTLIMTIILVGVIILTQTDYGRERARRLVLAQLAGSVNGTVQIGRISGNLLEGVTLSGLSITDAAGAPFLEADTLSFDYSLRSLRSRRIHLSNARLVGPFIVLDKHPGAEWNFARIFPGDTIPADTTARGFGSWIRIEDLTVRDGRLVIRNEWRPTASLRGAPRDSAIAAALSEDSRLRVVPVAGGYQSIHEFRHLDARMPLLRLADPDSTDIVVEVAELSTVANPFRPPPARIRDLSGRFVVSDDSIQFQGVRVKLPDSRVFADGALATRTGDLRARLLARPIDLRDLRWIDPALPERGGGSLELAVAANGPRRRVVARSLDLRLEGARLTGNAEVTFGDSLLLGPTELSLTGLDTRLVKRFARDAEIPVDGVLNGHLALAGASGDLDVDAELVFIERGGGRNRVTADGVIGLGGQVGEEINARHIRIRFDPLRVALARAFVPNLPIGGTITGSAIVSGSSATRLRIETDLVHRDSTGMSHVVGEARLRLAPPQPFDVDLRLQPVALRTVGRFAPGAGLYGNASGWLRAEGSRENLGGALELAMDGGGTLHARGSLDRAGGEQNYDVQMRLVRLDASRVSDRAPRTELTGTVTARGEGIDPATVSAFVSADLTEVRPDSTRIAAARVRVRLADGLAGVEEATLRLASTSAEVEGSFGLTGGRRGELAYRIQVDSLSDFARHVPVDTITAETAAGAPDSALMGSVRLAGTLSGNLENFELRGTAELEDVLVAGMGIGGGRADYAWLEGPTPDATFEVDATLDALQAAGLTFDSLSARVRHHEDGSGLADLAVYQDDGHEVGVRSRYDLAPEQAEIRLDSLRLHLDDTRWTLAQPGAVRWRGPGMEVDRIELREAGGGRIFVDGRLPAEGTGDLKLEIERFQIGDLVSLLPDTTEASGLLSVHATAQGTLADPRLRGDLRVADLVYGGGEITALEGSFEYADTELAARAAVRNSERAVLVAEGTLPLDLSLAGEVDQRLPDRPMRFDVRIDKLELDSLPQFTDAVIGMRGQLDGTIAIRGSPGEPEVDGIVRLDKGGMSFPQPGIELREVSAALTLREDVVVLDSLVAKSDGGAIRAAGSIDITTPTEPGFELTFEARGAKVLDNDQGRVVIDSDLAIDGPFEAVSVAGSINVLKGVIYIPEPEKQIIDLENPSVIAVIDTTRLDPVVLPRRNPLLDNLQVDVDVEISRNTWVRSSDANIELYTPSDDPLSLQLDQRQRTFTVDGSIQTDRGEYTYSGRQFQVSSGSIIFLGGPELDALLQILAEYEVPQPRGKPLAILITIGGTLSAPTIRLESNAQPPLSETDLLSYLAFGRSSSSLLVQGGSGLSEGSGAGDGLGALATQKLAGVALGALMDEVIEDLEAGGLNELGLDVFRISPAELPDELALEEGGNVFRSTELEAGKYVTPRIYVAGQGRATAAWPGTRFEYRIPGGFSWTTSWEPRYLPSEPTFDLDSEAQQTRVFGTFLLWEWRY